MLLSSYLSSWNQEAEQLVAQKLHPQTIIAGWRKAVEVADQALTQAAMDNRYWG